jgi:hypothetical protein
VSLARATTARIRSTANSQPHCRIQAADENPHESALLREWYNAPGSSYTRTLGEWIETNQPGSPLRRLSYIRKFILSGQRRGHSTPSATTRSPDSVPVRSQDRFHPGRTQLEENRDLRREKSRGVTPEASANLAAPFPPPLTPAFHCAILANKWRTGPTTRPRSLIPTNSFRRSGATSPC